MSASEKQTHRRIPDWLKTSSKGGKARKEVRNLLRSLNLHTVCESAACPNLCECWQKKSATFMILGNTCSRNCAFCNVNHGTPETVDPQEPVNVATAAKKLGLRYVVITSVTRDDLPDKGVGHFAQVINAVRAELPDAGIEVLTPDFMGEPDLIKTVIDARPTVFNHNIETCRRLTEQVRSDAQYDRTLHVLKTASQLSDTVKTKSGLMLGLGEEETEIEQVLRDLRDAGVEILTIGQYLPPTRNNFPLQRYVTPEEFDLWKERAEKEFGFKHVTSSPLARSSYHAEDAAESADNG